MGVRRRTKATDTAAKTPRWRRWVFGRLPIIVIAGLVAAVPGGGAMAVSRINERPIPGHPAAESWSDESRSDDLREDGAGDLDLAWTPTTRGRSGTTTGTARLVPAHRLRGGGQCGRDWGAPHGCILRILSSRCKWDCLSWG